MDQIYPQLLKRREVFKNKNYCYHRIKNKKPYLPGFKKTKILKNVEIYKFIHRGK
jgi:hypothetical protein